MVIFPGFSAVYHLLLILSLKPAVFFEYRWFGDVWTKAVLVISALSTYWAFLDISISVTVLFDFDFQLKFYSSLSLISFAISDILSIQIPLCCSIHDDQQENQHPYAARETELRVEA